MQTFLPLSDFTASANALDWRRLNKQRSEARIALKSISTKSGWYRHPAVQMWLGYEDALIAYSNTIITIWERRGYRNNMPLIPHGTVEFPPWFGDERFHASHRSNLLRKNPEHYGQFGWEESPDLPYFWPTKN
jgi:hypothetical protein